MNKYGSGGARAIAMLLLITVAALPTVAQAHPGALDHSFGESGKLVKAVDLEPYAWNSAPTAMAKLSSGVTIVLAGQTLFAVKPDGRLATGFGGGRIKVVAPTGGTLRLSDLASAPGGLILVAGVFVSDSAADHSDPIGEQLFIARYRSDGSLDPTFGSGGDLVTTAGQSPPRKVSPVEEEPWAAPRLKLGGIAVDADGRIVVTGSRLDFVSTCRTFFANFSFYEGFVARLGQDGALDPGFGQGGMTLLSDAETVAAPLLTKGGGIYLSARPRFACYPSPEFGLAIRLGANGWPVSSFGSGGRVQLPEEHSPQPIAPVMDHSRGILFPGASFVRMVLPTGELDRSFGEQGAASLGIAGGISVIAVDSHGRILGAGASSPLSGPEPPKSSFSLGRLTRNGRIDRRFGRGGVISTRFGGRSSARPTSLVLVRGGEILAAGTLASPSLGGEQGLAMARYSSR